MPKTLLIRADAGGALGTGHVMRMLALAQAWRARGGRACLASVRCPAGLVDRLAREGIAHCRLDACEPGGADDAAQTLRLGETYDATWIALDGYHHTFAIQEALHRSGFKVMAVDDYGHSDAWCADLILNQNFGAETRRYANQVADAMQLNGPAFALLRREFWTAAAASPVPPGADLERILVTLGGVDADNFTGRMLASLEAAELAPLEIRVLVGAGNSHQALLERQAAKSRHRVALVRDCPDMPSMYRWADGVISAAGSTCYEWLLFGLPAAVISVADNQDFIAAWLKEHDLAAVLVPSRPDVPRDWAAALTAWSRDASARARRVQRSAGMVDPRGACRVTAELLTITAYRNKEVTCRG